MRKVLIIENSEGEFKEVSLKFENSGWEVLPNNYDDIGELFEAERNKELLAEIENYLEVHYKEIGMIVLDIALLDISGRDRFGLKKILPIIRTFSKVDEDYKNWGKQVPIIAYSQNDSMETKQKALGEIHHVHTFISKTEAKDAPEELLLTAEALYSIYAMNSSFGGFSDYIDRYFEKLGDFIEKTSEGISAKIDNLNILINGKASEIKDRLDIILKASLIKLNNNEIESIIEDFKGQLERTVGSEELEKMKGKVENDKFRDQCKALLKNGSFSEFTTFIIKSLEEIGVLGYLPGGKIIGAAVSSIVKILSKNA